ncbi:MAG: hypothetical protein JJU13_13635 [Balneolaceae bacterium]|nr:hypothetical protein [Balneolaceae bacterium]
MKKLLWLLPIIGALLLLGQSCSTKSTPVYQLNTSVEPSEAGSVNQSATEAEEGETITITAKANEHWVFDRWSGDHSGTDNPASIVMDTDKSVTALFEKRDYPLTIHIEGEGTVDERVVQAKTTDYPHGTVVELTADPDEGWKFSGWSGDVESAEEVIEVTIDDRINITATFNRIKYPLIISIKGEGTVDQEVIAAKTTEYPNETVVELTATPSEGWIFTGWEGDIEGNENPVNITISKEVNVTAIFSTPDVNHIILRVVHVTEDWMPFSSNSGWQRAAPIKEKHGVKFYEVAIWDETLSIHLYEFPNDYDPNYGVREGLSDEERISYREKFSLKTVTGMPPQLQDRSSFVIDAFHKFSQILVDRHPDAIHNLVYSGHGSPGGELFARHLDPEEAHILLNNWTSLLGRNLGFIDMGGPCNKGGFGDLQVFCQYSKYYIASDLVNGGYAIDDFSLETYRMSDIDYNYPRILGTNDNLQKALIDRINIRRLRYEVSINNITKNEVMQANYLYSCNEFLSHEDEISYFMKKINAKSHVDILSEMQIHNAEPSLINKVKSIISYGVDTKDFFTWPVEKNGILWTK